MKKKVIISILSTFLSLVYSYSQNRVITGQVLDYRGIPIAGVTIIDKDYPSLTTITGVDGQFRIVVYNFTKVMQFSFANMRTKNVTLDEKNQLLVIMEYLPWHNAHPWNYILNFQLGRTDVFNPSKSDNESWSVSGAPGTSVSFEVAYFISQKLGISCGIGINQYNGKAWLNNFNNYSINNLIRTDIDNEEFYLYNAVNNLDEKTKVNTLSLPLKLKYRFKPGKKWDYFIDAGIKFMYTSKASVKANGQCTWQGYYPQYHVVLYDLSDYGFTDYLLNSEYEIPDYNKFISSFTVDFGISHSWGKQANIDFGLFYERGISDLEYNKPAHPADFLNTIGTVDKTIVKAWGVILSFKYNILKKR